MGTGTVPVETRVPRLIERICRQCERTSHPWKDDDNFDVSLCGNAIYCMATQLVGDPIYNEPIEYLGGYTK